MKELPHFVVFIERTILLQRWKKIILKLYIRCVQLCNTAGPNAHDQIVPRAAAACVNLCV